MAIIMKKRLVLFTVIIVIIIMAGCRLWDGPFGDPTAFRVAEWTFNDHSYIGNGEAKVWDSSNYSHDGYIELARDGEKDYLIEYGYSNYGDPQYVLEVVQKENAMSVYPGAGSVLLDVGAPMTVEAWVYLYDSDADYRPIVHFEGYYTLYYSDLEGLVFKVETEGDPVSYVLDVELNTEQWYHVAVVVEHSRWRRLHLFVDGDSHVASHYDLELDSWNSPESHSLIWVGKEDEAVLDGLLDHVRISEIDVSQGWLGYYRDFDDFFIPIF